MEESIDIFGVIFKENDKLFIIEYLGDNNFSKKRLLTNNFPYRKMNNNQISLVFANKKDHKLGYIYNVRNLAFVTIENSINTYKALKNKEVKQEISDFFEDIITKALEEEENDT
jgi:hypothetical protein